MGPTQRGLTQHRRRADLGGSCALQHTACAPLSRPSSWRSLLSLAPAGPVSAADPLPVTKLTLSARPPARPVGRRPFTATLTEAGGAPIAGARLVLQRRAPDRHHGPRRHHRRRGRVVMGAARPSGTTTWRASYAGDSDARRSRRPTSSASRVVATRAPIRLTDRPTAGRRAHQRRSRVLWTAADASNGQRRRRPIQRKLRSGAVAPSRGGCAPIRPAGSRSPFGRGSTPSGGRSAPPAAWWPADASPSS